MKKQSDSNDADFRKESHNGITADSIIRVERMEANTAAVGIKEWRSEQVVQVDEHGGDHDQPGFFPFLSEKQPGDQSGSQKVEAVMNYRLEQGQKGTAGHFVGFCVEIRVVWTYFYKFACLPGY